MSQAATYDWTELPDDDVFHVLHTVPVRHPTHATLTFSMIAAVLAAGMSGATIAWKWHQYEAFDTAALAAVAPSQADLPFDGSRDAQVVHDRLVVLTPPVYPQGSAPARETIPQASQVLAPALVSALAAPDEPTPDATAEEMAPPAELAADGDSQANRL